MNDRSYKHFFIAPKCAKIIENEEVRAFFELLVSGSAKTQYTNDLKNYVEDAKHNTQWRMQYMTWERQRTYDYNDGKADGLIEGAQQNAIECAINALKLGIEKEKISKITSLTIEEIVELQEEITEKA